MDTNQFLQLLQLLQQQAPQLPVVQTSLVDKLTTVATIVGTVALVLWRFYESFKKMQLEVKTQVEEVHKIVNAKDSAKDEEVKKLTDVVLKLTGNVTGLEAQIVEMNKAKDLAAVDPKK